MFNGRQMRVIPSRADSEGPLQCKLRYPAKHAAVPVK